MPSTTAIRTRSHPEPRRRSTAASDLIFSPREYQQVYTERAYLVSALQAQSLRATDLIRQYSSVDEQLQRVADVPGKQRRRLRKQLSLLRARLNDTGSQERALLVRLGELCVELQSQEAWDQARRERRAFCQSAAGGDGGTTEVSCSYFALSPTSYVSQEPSADGGAACLNAATPEFVPRDSAVDATWWSGLRSLETVDGADDDLLNHGLEYEYEHEEGTCEAVVRRRPSLDGEMLSPREKGEKRLSLPNLRSMWPQHEAP
ncbi:hypothetical protein ACO1O0_008484 [Amphichorda felina]